MKKDEVPEQPEKQPDSQKLPSQIKARDLRELKQESQRPPKDPFEDLSYTQLQKPLHGVFSRQAPRDPSYQELNPVKDGESSDEFRNVKNRDLESLFSEDNSFDFEGPKLSNLLTHFLGTIKRESEGDRYSPYNKDQENFYFEASGFSTGSKAERSGNAFLPNLNYTRSQVSIDIDLHLLYKLKRISDNQKPKFYGILRKISSGLINLELTVVIKDVEYVEKIPFHDLRVNYRRPLSNRDYYMSYSYDPKLKILNIKITLAKR